MSSPRAVQVQVAPAPRWRLALRVVAGLAALVLGVWLHAHGQALALVLGLPLAIGLPLLLAPARLLGPGRPCALAWDGRQWRLPPEDRPVAIRPMLDLGDALLLRLDGHGALRPMPRWWALQRRSTAGDWAALRAALYSARPEGSPPASGEPLPPDRLP